MGELSPPAGFLEAASALGIEFEAGDVERLGRYLGQLLETNKVHNLTAVTDPDQAWTRHILDSLTLMPLLVEVEGARDARETAAGGGAGVPARQGTSLLSGGGRDARPTFHTRVIDVGSGGGLPGIPLAITMPGIEFTLLEATGKKAEFLTRVVKELGVKNARVVNERAERAGQSEAHRERYDAVVARAVGPMAVIAELTVPLAKVGGRVLLIKGQKAEEELAAAKQALHRLHATLSGVVETPTGRIVVLEKGRKTPREYPRRDGEPKRAPLGS